MLVLTHAYAILIYWLMLTKYTYTCIHKQAGLDTGSMNDPIMSDTSSIAPALRNQNFLNGANQHSPIAEAHQPDSEQVDYEDDSLYKDRPFAGAYFTAPAATASNNIGIASSAR
jgi:hypothetical protein